MLHFKLHIVIFCIEKSSRHNPGKTTISFFLCYTKIKIKKAINSNIYSILCVNVLINK